jgi:hypothetical protein
MKNILRIVVIIACFSSKQQLQAQPVMTFFMRPYLTAPTDENYEQMATKLAKPGHIARRNGAIRNFAIVSGIFSTYAGYLAMSNSFGQTIFPLKHSLPLVYFVVTPKITPIMMAGNTIHHWEIEQNSPAQIYKVERHHLEPDNIYYWQVDAVPLPDKNILPPISITILARPKDIVIPEGMTLTNDAANLLLPDIYIRKTINKEANALYLLNIKHFFGQLHPLYKRDVTRYLTHTHD